MRAKEFHFWMSLATSAKQRGRLKHAFIRLRIQDRRYTR